MNWTLIEFAIRQKATEGLWMFLTGAFFVLSLLGVGFTSATGLSDATAALVFCLLLSGGAIGPDSASGVQMLLFTRPISRSDYVLSKWFAGMGCAVAAFLALLLLQSLILSMRHLAPEAEEILSKAGQGSLLVVGVSSVLTFISSWVSRRGDALVFLFGIAAFWTLKTLGKMMGFNLIDRAATQIVITLLPEGPLDLKAALRVALTMAASLSLAIWVVSRREISYAQKAS